jgi:phage terminase large subunit-like protein
MSWDIALSEIESGDYSACVVLLIRKEIVYILEVVRGCFPFEALKRRLWSSSGGTVLPLF